MQMSGNGEGALVALQQSATSAQSPSVGNGTRYGSLGDPNTPMRERLPGTSRKRSDVYIGTPAAGGTSTADEEINEHYSG